MLSGPDILVVLVIALLVFGPKKLPELAKSLGKAMREFKTASEDMRETFEGEMKKIEEKTESSVSKASGTELPETKSGLLALPERTGKVSPTNLDSFSEKA